MIEIEANQINPLLIDFGLARIKHEATRPATGITDGGSLRYLSPELASAIIHNSQKFRTSAASDCYAFAMTILCLATLLPPFFKYKTDHSAMLAAERGEQPDRPEDLGALPPHIADVLWSLLTDMWKHRPSDRPALDEVQRRLEGIASMLSLA